MSGQDVVIVGMARTPFGSLQGALSAIPASKLGALAIQEALSRSGLQATQLTEVSSEVIMGNVLMAGQGQAPARQAAIYAGIPTSVPAMTVNKMCGSGMKALMLGMQSIVLGESDIVIAGGMESMSQAPYLVHGARSGFRMGHQSLMDSMILDGLWDPYDNQHMGNCAELCARERRFSRAEQDAYAVESFKRAQEAQKSGKFKAEIAVVEIPGQKKGAQKGEPLRVDADEGPSKVQFDKIPTLKPAFDKEGSVTAANASTINDGAAALILTSSAKAKELHLKPLAKIVSSATHAQEPKWFTTAPAEAMRKAMRKATWSPERVDLYEVNEAFAVVAMAAQKELHIPYDRLNVWGSYLSWSSDWREWGSYSDDAGFCVKRQGPEARSGWHLHWRR